VRPAVHKVRREGAVDQAPGQDRLGFEVATPPEKKAPRAEQQESPEEKDHTPAHLTAPRNDPPLRS
jgi:hypothetical protein